MLIDEVDKRNIPELIPRGVHEVHTDYRCYAGCESVGLSGLALYIPATRQ